MFAIEAVNLSKTYRFYRRPVDRLKEALLRRPFHQPIDSLKNVSLTVECGDTLGVVGANGAGKSTLLKILAGTLAPTAGTLTVRGRTSALLELGAGFHTEFTGRQNIYLNGALLGLTEAEIRDRETDIIDFAELGDFIDRPLKTYSSGMVIRLGFSIATSVDPDVLIVDEALSVGDQYFQKKCVDRMAGFRERGKTIILCTHAMHLVNQLCRRALWIDHGVIRDQGAATRVTAAYENTSRAKTAARGQAPPAPDAAQEPPPIKIRNIFLNGRSEPLDLPYRQDLDVTLDYESFARRPFWVAVGIRRNDDLICHAVSLSRDRAEPLEGLGEGRLMLRYPALPLLHGQYFVNVVIMDDTGLHVYDRGESAPLTIIPPEEWKKEVGLLDLEHQWHIP